MLEAVSPFSDSGITLGQLGYYGPDAILSGVNPKVGWSMLIRDLLANPGANSLAVRSPVSKWCAGMDMNSGDCPALAVEIQVRSPVPMVPDLTAGYTLEDPLHKQRVAEIPPMPAGML